MKNDLKLKEMLNNSKDFYDDSIYNYSNNNSSL